jgi:hypothetical protein
MKVGPSAVNGRIVAQLTAVAVGQRFVHHVPLRELALPVAGDVLDVRAIAARSASGLRPLTQNASCWCQTSV